jgi:ribonucleotide monophosphatase NagD (HAD superfamily)
MTTHLRSTAAQVSIHRGIREIAHLYDAWIFDQWGVLHNGQQAFPGVEECLAELHRLGKKKIILSNSSKREAPTMAALSGMGISSEFFMGAVTSGEQTYQALKRGYQNKKCLLLSWEDSPGRSAFPDFMQELGITAVGAAEADFVLAHGTHLIHTTGVDRPGDVITTNLYERGKESLPLYAPYLEQAVSRKLPMVCANPDFGAIQGDAYRYVTGTIAKYYEQLGGEVQHTPLHSLAHSCTHSIAHARTHARTHPGTHPPTHHPPTHPLPLAQSP